MSRKRFDLKVAKITLNNNLIGILRSTPMELKSCQKLMTDFVKGVGDPDPRTRFMSAKDKLDRAHRVFEYENPVVQRSEMEIKGLPIPPSELVVRIISSDKEKKGKVKSAVNKR